MILLLTQAWPWLVFGTLLIAWGLFIVRFTPSQWIGLISSIFFSFFSDSTKKEKRVLSETSFDEAAEGNPGCLILLVGLVIAGFGLIRWLI